VNAVPEIEIHESPSDPPSLVERYEEGQGRPAVAWTSLVFAVLQSLCTAVAGLQTLRLAIGVSSLALSGTTLAVLRDLHADWIRVPMVLLALAGSLLNVVVLLHVRHLRQNPAGNWRRRTRSTRERRVEAWQWAVSILTLLSIAVEEYIHFQFHQHL
jgi:hypothetical protein